MYAYNRCTELLHELYISQIYVKYLQMNDKGLSPKKIKIDHSLFGTWFIFTEHQSMDVILFLVIHQLFLSGSIPAFAG